MALITDAKARTISPGSPPVPHGVVNENSTDTELLTYFTSHGLSQEQASNVLRQREDYLLNIYLAGHGSLHDN